METKEFKKLAKRVLVAHGFTRKGSYFYKRSDTVICVVSLQKSSYACGYYVNVGYVLVDLHPELEYPRVVDGDIQSRLDFEHKGRSADFFDLDDEELMCDTERILAEGIAEEVPVPLSTDGIKSMIARNPELLYVTLPQAKRFLGYA